MQHPKSIRVLGRKFRVAYRDILNAPPGTLGQTYGAENLIEISTLSHDTPKDIRTTLLHEALHAALHVSGLSIYLDDRLEEALVTMLTHAVEEIAPQLPTTEKV